MIHVLAVIELHPECRSGFLTEFRKIIGPVRAEKGCIEYGPAVDLDSGIASQQAPRENTVTIIEKWESLEDLKAHLVAPHMVAYRPKVKDYVASSKLYVLEPT